MRFVCEVESEGERKREGERKKGKLDWRGED